MEIIIDSREPEDIFVKFVILQEEMEKKGELIDIKRQMIGVGDVIVDNKICFERKDGEDYVSSIIDGRMKNQAKAMEYYPYKYIVFVGSLWDYVSAINPRAVIGMQASMAVRNKINFFHVQNNEGFCWLVYTISKKILEVESHLLKNKII